MARCPQGATGKSDRSRGGRLYREQETRVQRVLVLGYLYVQREAVGSGVGEVGGVSRPEGSEDVCSTSRS